MAEKTYKTLRDFYPYYLTEHQHPVSQLLHFIGTGLFLCIVAYSIWQGAWWVLLLGPVAGYGFAWVGHFFFEKNKPATFVYPAFSLASDFIMFYHILSFQLPKKMAEAKQRIGA